MTKEIIKEIKEINIPRVLSSFDGYEILTNKRKIQILIEAEQQCCESFGFLTSEDNFDEYLGAEIKEIVATDNDLRAKIMGRFGREECVDMVFLTVKTDRGDLQFVAYNAHNGFYGHDTLVVIEDLENGKKEILDSIGGREWT